MFEWLGLETVAVILGIAYLLFAMRENSLCWYCAFISTGIYIWILAMLACIWSQRLMLTIWLWQSMAGISGSAVAVALRELN